MQDRPQRCIFFSAFTAGFSKFSEVQVERQQLPFSLPIFRSWVSNQNVHKDNENSDFSVEETEHASHNISGRYFNNGGLEGGNDSSTGHVDVYILQGLDFLINIKKSVLQPAYTVDRIFGYRDKLSRNDYKSSQKEERSNCDSVSASFGEVTCNSKVTDPASWSSVLNISCSSPCTSSVSCNSKSTNNGIAQREKLQLSDNLNRGGHKRIELVDSKSAFDRGEVFNFRSTRILIDSHASLKDWGAYCQGLKFAGPWTFLEKKDHINVLELKAAKNAILTFTRMFPSAKSLHIRVNILYLIMDIIFNKNGKGSKKITNFTIQPRGSRLQQNTFQGP